VNRSTSRMISPLTPPGSGHLTSGWAASMQESRDNLRLTPTMAEAR
jgi:hypothetical protein